jgi:catechol 2,3-dioxygenase
MDTEQQRASGASATSIDPGTQVGALSLTVADLDRSIAFYRDVMGFALMARSDEYATLGVAGAPLLLLRAQAGARPFPAHGVTGLYHFAILVPTRADLGRWLRHWLDLGLPLPGQGDHLVSEALYLSDPDRNGIEVYRDRPRAEWTWDCGQVRMASDPVDIRGVLEEAARQGEPWAGLAAGTRIGHMHLQVGDIARAEAFYHGVLGFDVVAHMPSALFVSAGGYHHHIGMNTWQSRGAGPAPAGTAGLRFFTLELAGEEARAAVVARVRAAGLDVAEADGVVAVRDPWRNTLLLHLGPLPDADAAGALAAAWPAGE